MKLERIKISKTDVAYTLRWLVFIFASFTLAMKIAEVSAYETTKIILANPEITQYSTLVNSGYLPF